MLLSLQQPFENSLLTFLVSLSDTGQYEDVAEIARLLDEKHKKTGLDVNIHGTAFFFEPSGLTRR